MKFFLKFNAFSDFHAGCIPSGKRFMTDLLVSSLMADGGLEAALMAAIKVEVQDLENIFFEKELKDKDTNEEEPLMTEQAQMESESKRYHFRFVYVYI